REQLAGQATAEGRPVIVGIRPESLRLAIGEDMSTLAGTVDVVEHLGSEQLAYVRVPGLVVPEAAAAAREGRADEVGSATVTSAIARIDPGVQVAPGERIALAVDTARLHVFDPATQQRFV